MSYWERRQEQEMYKAMDAAEQTAAEIADIYAKASRELNFRISQVFERYKDKYNLSDQDAEKLLNAMKDPADFEELKKKLDSILRGPEADAIRKELEAPAYRARIERLQNLQGEIDRMMADVYSQEKQVSTDCYVNQYNNAYYREIYDLKSRTGLDFSFSHVDPKEMNRILNMNWSGENYSTRIWNNTQGLARDLKEQLTLAYLTGKRESDIAAEIARKYSTGAANARRLVRTEAAFVSGQAQADADKDADIDSYRILATLDLRTSEICREMDGKVFSYDDMEVGKNYPPFHPYCRTTVLSELDDQDLSELKRRARDPVTGKVRTFNGDITYNEWYKENVANNPEALFAEKVEQHRGADMQQYSKYKEVLGKDAGSIDSFRRTKYLEPEKYDELKKNYVDTKQYKELKELLGDIEQLKDVDAFKTIKYNDEETYSLLRLAAKRRDEMLNHPELKPPLMPKTNIPDGKFTRYLFDGTNKKGLAKGRAIASRLGYDISNWQEYKDEILKYSEFYPTYEKGERKAGLLYEQKMILFGKNGKPANVVVGWIADEEKKELRMTNAYIKEVKYGNKRV